MTKPDSTAHWSPLGSFTSSLIVGAVLAVQATGLLALHRGLERQARVQAAEELRVGERLLQRLAAERRADAASLASGGEAAGALAEELHRLVPSVDVVLLAKDRSDPAWHAVASTIGDASAVESLRGEDSRVSIARAEHALLRAPLADAGDARATAVLLRSTDAALAPYRPLELALAALGLLLAAGLGACTTTASRRAQQRIAELSRAARRIGNGDTQSRVPGTEHADPLGELARDFDAMRASMQRHQHEALQAAHWDKLTGLPNRAQFGQLVARAIDHAKETQRSVAVVMLDLDRFKRVNDVLGHAAGDRLLQAVGERLRSDCVREGDAVARLAGDEFALLLPGADDKLAATITERIESSFERPIQLGEHPIDVSAGIGVACWPQHGSDADALVSRAEVAMIMAKRRGGGALLYDASIDAAHQQTLTLLTDLQRAFDNGELRLYLQPKIALQHGQVVGAEALLRWQHPQRGLVVPANFIPFAEQLGFIRQLTMWVFERAADEWRRLHAQGQSLRISINLGVRDLLDPDLAEKLDALLVKHSVPAEAFCLEVTEAALLSDPPRAQATLERLSRRGLRIAIDDFGTGHSSLAYLKRLPVDELKIDRTFVAGMERDLDDAKIVRSTIDLAHNLGLTVTAEGVETSSALRQLRDLGCDEAQGHQIAKPLPSDQFTAWCVMWATRVGASGGDRNADSRNVVLH